MDPAFAQGELGVISTFDKSALDVIGWDVFGEDYIVRVNPSNSAQGQLVLNSQVLIDDWAIVNGLQLNLSPGSGNDSLTMDYSDGNPLPNGFVRFHGGAESDTVTFLGTLSADDFLMEKPARNFTMEVNSDEPTEFQLLGVQTVVVDAAGGSDELVVDWGRGSPIPSVGLSFPSDTPPESFLARDANGNETPAFMVNRTSDLVDTVADGILDVDVGTTGRQISLRAAIQYVNGLGGGGTIFLQDADYVLTRAGTDDVSSTGDLDITGDVTIVGVGAGASVIDAGGSSGIQERVFHVLSTGDLVLSQTTVKGGYFLGTSAHGGGIRVVGTLTLTESAVVGNTAGGVGGGIYNDGSSASVTVLDSVIARNHVANTSASNQNGGAGVYATNGTLELGNTIVAKNTADILASGGAYDVYGNAANINSLANNLLESVRWSLTGDFTVGNDMIGSVDYVVTSVVDGNDSGISANLRSLREAVIVADDDADATIWVPAWHHKFTLAGSDDNNAGGDLDVSGDLTIVGIGAGLTIIDAGGEWGVGDRVLDVQSGGELELSWATITGGNSANSGGGIRVAGEFHLFESAIVGNTSSSTGGGIYTSSSAAEAYVEQCVIANNHLSNVGASNQHGGAGIYSTSGYLLLLSSIVANNTADVLDSVGAADLYVDEVTTSGSNLLEDVTIILPNIFNDDETGHPDYIVTSMNDTISHHDDDIALSLREAVDLANNHNGEDEIWVPAWRVRLTRIGSDSGSPDVKIGDLDVLEDLLVTGISDDGIHETILDGDAIADQVFDQIGSADLEVYRLTIING